MTACRRAALAGVVGRLDAVNVHEHSRSQWTTPSKESPNSSVTAVASREGRTANTVKAGASPQPTFRGPLFGRRFVHRENGLIRQLRWPTRRKPAARRRSPGSAASLPTRSSKAAGEPAQETRRHATSTVESNPSAARRAQSVADRLGWSGRPAAVPHRSSRRSPGQTSRCRWYSVTCGSIGGSSHT